MKKPMSLWVKILYFLWLISIITGVPGCIQRSQLPNKTYASPQIIEEYINFDSYPISQILNDSTYLYVMADSHQGYVQVYDLFGNYQKTISLYAPSPNGGFEMATDSDMLYIQDTGRNIYVFQSGDFVRFIKEDDVPQQLKEISYNENSVNYQIRYGSIWRIDGQEQTCLIQRSPRAIFYQYYLNWLIMFAAVLSMGFYVLKKKTGKSADS